MLHIILFQPETDRQLKRSGMDYWQDLNVIEHPSWEAFTESPLCPKRIWLFTTKSTQAYWNIQFQEGDGLLFRNEGHGVPDAVRKWDGLAGSLTIPHMNDSLRSLNLATSAGIATYEALRQLKI